MFFHDKINLIEIDIFIVKTHADSFSDYSPA